MRAEGFTPNTLQGHGGSVSRRDLNQAYRKVIALAGGTNPEESHKPNASRSSGERGLGGEGLLSEKPPLPPASPSPRLFGREREGGDFSSRKVPSLAFTSSQPMNVFDVFLGVLGAVEGGAQHGNVQTGGAETGEIVEGNAAVGLNVHGTTSFIFFKAAFEYVRTTASL